MPGSAITESDSFATTLTTPLPGEPASASALLSEFLQGAANRTRWLFNRLNVFVIGGTLTPTGSVVLTTPTTKTIALNQITAPASADGGGAVVDGSNGLSVTSSNGISVPNGGAEIGGRVHAPRAIVAGGVTAATLFGYSSATTDQVFNTAPMGAGASWKITDSPAPGSLHYRISFFNTSSVGVAILDPAGGTLLAALKLASGFPYYVEFVSIGGVWQICNETFGA